MKWDDGADTAILTNGLKPHERDEHEGAIGLVQIQALADDPCVYFDLDLAKCMRRWLDDAIRVAEESLSAAR